MNTIRWWLPIVVAMAGLAGCAGRAQAETLADSVASTTSSTTIAAQTAALPPLYIPSPGLAANDPYVSALVFHWHTATNGLKDGPWRPLEGRTNWTGEVTWWKGQIKQMMAANLDVLHVHCMDIFEPQRVNLFQALADLRAEGYEVPKVGAFFDAETVWWTKPGPDLATAAGKDAFASHYIRFFQQFFSVNTDPHAADYLATLNGRVLLSTWHLQWRCQNIPSLSRADLQSRLEAGLAAVYPGITNGFRFLGTAGSPMPPFNDENVQFFTVHAYFAPIDSGGYVNAMIKPGYWDQNIRNPGFLLPRDGGWNYDTGWSSVHATPAIRHVYIESWNEYDEGSGIYAANPGPPDLKPGSGNTSTDTWSNVNDPYHYIRATAAGARRFNRTPDFGAKFLWQALPTNVMAGLRRSDVVVLRNAGDVAWSDAAGFRLEQRLSGSGFAVTNVYRLDDAAHDIPTFGGIFRGRPVTMTLDWSPPAVTGLYQHVLQAVFAAPPRTYANDTVFNWHANTSNSPAGEQPPGLATNVTHAPLYPGIGLTPESVLGAIDASIEADAIVFADGGTPDNGNQVIEPALETVDHFTFATRAPVPLTGYRLFFGRDGGPKSFRATELVEFSVNGQVTDLFDMDGGIGWTNRVLTQAVTGQTFRVRLTRATEGGPRLRELDATLPAASLTIQEPPTPVGEPLILPLIVQPATGFVTTVR